MLSKVIKKKVFLFFGFLIGGGSVVSAGELISHPEYPGENIFKIQKHGDIVGAIEFAPKGFGQEFLIENRTNSRYTVEMECDMGGSRTSTIFGVGARQTETGSIAEQAPPGSSCGVSDISISIR